MDLKKEAAAKAITLVPGQSILGLGAGSTISWVVTFLKEEIKNGLVVQVLTSSFTTRQLLKQNAIPVHDIALFEKIDIYLDGCDQFDKDLNALKSGGGIHTREKLFATMASQFIIVGDEAKYAEKLETKFPLVLEVLPEALGFVPARVEQLFPGVKHSLRIDNKKDGPVITENHNYLIELWFEEWPELSGINPALKNIAGVVETSLFYDLAQKAVIAGEKGIRIFEK